MSRLPANRAQNIHYGLIAERKIQSGEIVMDLGPGIDFKVLRERYCDWCGEQFEPVSNSSYCGKACRSAARTLNGKRFSNPRDQQALPKALAERLAKLPSKFTGQQAIKILGMSISACRSTLRRLEAAGKLVRVGLWNWRKA